jgi:hypothetical protein
MAKDSRNIEKIKGSRKSRLWKVEGCEDLKARDCGHCPVEEFQTTVKHYGLSVSTPKAQDL